MFFYFFREIFTVNPQSLTTGLSGKLEQHQLLSHTQMRSLEVLAMPLAGVLQSVAQELAVNPMLEMEEFSFAPAELPDSPRQSETPDADDYEANSTLSEEWRENLPLPADTPPGDENFDYLANLPAPPPQLRTMLLEELFAMELDEKTRLIAQEIIFSLNDDGFLTVPAADLAMVCDAELFEVEDALKLVQQIAPAGVGARDLGESLKLQLIRQGKLSSVMEKLLSEGLEYLENNRRSELEKKLGISADELDGLLHTLRALNPFPGRSASPASSGEVITPELIISRKEDGEYFVALARESMPPIRLSGYYEKLLEDRTLSAEDRNFLNEKAARARELIQAVMERGNTLLRIGELIIRRQKDFLDNGVESLHPFTMTEAASLLELSESTVSRAVAGKYADTPRGVIALKFFFPSGGTQELSNQAVISKIRALIENENPDSPLSDDEISGILKKQGISVARRTVAKYRDALNIPSSSRRKRR